MARFDCSNCGAGGALIGMFNTDSRGMTSCPVCRTPVAVLAGDAPGKQPENFPQLLLRGMLAGLFMLPTFVIVHVGLWYLFSVDVVAWGGISIIGFFLPYYYLALIVLAVAMFAGFVSENQQLKTRARENG